MIDIKQRITAAIERITSGNAPMRVPADETDPDLVLAYCLAEIRRLRAALAARQPVGISADWVLGYLNTDAPEESREAIRNAFAEYAALSGARQPVGEPGEMSPEFTDTARAAIAWVLWHHQGGSSPVGQPLRFALGMGQHDRMTDHQIAEAKRFAAWANATTEDFHHRAPAQAVDLGQFRTKVAELLRSEFDLEVADPEDHRHDDGSGEADRIAGKIIALLDSRAVGNG